MQQLHNKQQTESKNVLKHSSLAVASFVLSTFALIFIILIGGAITENRASTPIGLLLFITCAIVSTVLAIVDLTKDNRKKTLAIWALVFNWGWLLLSIVLMISYFIYTKTIAR